MSGRRSRGGARKNRPRPTPKWLMSSEQIDKVAQARCLLVLRVLSGETPVSEAIEEAGISRGNYYQLESRALKAMLRALTPGVSEEDEESSPARQMAALEQKVKKLEQARRRTERLLVLTRKVVEGTAVKLRGKTPSTRSGKKPSRRSKMAANNVKPSPSSSPSMTTGDGASTP